MIQVESRRKLICAGGQGIWGPALTPLFLWLTFKGGLRGGAREREQALMGVWVERGTVLASEYVPCVCGTCQYHLPGSPSRADCRLGDRAWGY